MGDVNIIRYLKRMLNDYYTLDSFGSKKNLLMHSYARWAIKEIMKRINANPSTSPLTVVENFKRQMNEYACKNKISGIIFSIAYDVAEDITDKLINKWCC
jgi:hypothetical protein